MLVAESAIARPLVSTRWITGAKFDLLIYIGACLTGYLLIYVNLGLGVSALLLRWFWILAVDGPHIFATISRTYLDAEEWRTRSRLLWGSLLWFLVGPAFFAAALGTGSMVPFLAFLVLAELWAYWHVVRQHYGFMVLYQRKNGEVSGQANRADYYIFYVLMLLPFVSFLLRHPQSRELLGLASTFTTLENMVLYFLHTALAAAVVLYALKEVLLWRRGGTLNLPKNLFLFACVPLHMLVFLHPYISTKVDLRLFAVFVTFYHNVQYHGIVWFYNRNRYHQKDSGNRYGPAKFVSRSFLTFYAIGILFTVLYRYSNWYFLGLPVPLSSGPNGFSEMSLGPLFKVSDLALACWWGFAFNHYYLDQKIWRVSKDKRVGAGLKIEQR